MNLSDEVHYITHLNRFTMKNPFVLKLILMTFCTSLLASCGFFNGGGDTIDGNKNVRIIQVERELPFPIDTVWNKIFLDYGGASKFNPKVVSSGYLGPIKEAKIGAERFMYNDAAGEEGIHERIIHFDSEKKVMRFQIFKAINLPVDTSVTIGESQLIALDHKSTLFKIKFQYRTTPKILAHFANGSLTKDFKRMTVAIEHFLTTGEQVTAENFDDYIANLYQ